MKKFLLVSVMGLFSFGNVLTSCTTPSGSVYIRPDVDVSESKIIVFPLLVKQGGDLKSANENLNNPALDAILVKGWASELGTENSVTVPKVALNNLPKGWEGLDLLLKAFDESSNLEQQYKDTPVVEVMAAVGKTFGDGALAFAIVNQNEEAYKTSKVIQGSMGLFDIKKLTWKWITKTSFDAGLVPEPYPVVIQNLFDDSIKILKEKNNGKVR